MIHVMRSLHVYKWQSNRNIEYYFIAYYVHVNKILCTCTQNAVVTELFIVHTSVNQHIGNGEHKPSPAQKMPSAEHSDSGEETDEMDEMDEMDKMDEMDEMDEMEGQDKASLPAMTFMKRKVSTASVTSMYSAACGKGDYEISGKILLGVWHKEEQLFVRVTRAKKLAAAKDDGVSDPYIETHLLPDKSKQTKRKTTVQKKTLDPVYDEILKVGPYVKQLGLEYGVVKYCNVIV